MENQTSKRLVIASSNSPEELKPPRGPYPILRILQESGTPVTRANYLALSSPGVNPKNQLDPEAELELPPELRLGWGPQVEE